ncbi:MAG: AMP-binding protein [Bryobacteraceae bacterium]
MANAARSRENLASLVSDFQRHANEIAIVSRRGLRHSCFSYGDLALSAGRFAALLFKSGIGKGERVLLWAPNSGEWVGAFFGCVLRGVLPVPLDNAGAPEFVERVVRDVGPKLVVTTAAHAREIQTESQVIVVEELRERLPGTPLFEAERLTAGDSLQIIFTSGTTGEPKGIVHTHGNVLASLRPIEEEIGKYRKYERIFHPLRFLHTLPLSHVFGQFMGLWIPPLIAAEVHFEDRLLASDLVELIRSKRISVLAGVPRVLDLMREHLHQRYPGVEQRRERARGASALKRWWMFRDIHRHFGFKFWALICGGAALGAELEEFWNSLGFVVVQGYGMTETTALVSLNHPFHASSGTLGQILPGREVKLGEDGEVLVRGETISQAVWRNGRLQPLEEAWLATGDLAELDASGNLRFRGRKKETIVTAAGLNIYPDDLEAALAKQAEVKAAAVVETEGQYGPEPLAVMVLRNGNAAEVVARANASLAEYQRMQRWVVWPEPDLPRTSTGKVMRREVARIVNTNLDTRSVKGSLAAILRRIRNSSTGESETDQELNLDSLARVELQASLEEQFGVTIDDAAMQGIRTVDDLRAAIEHPTPSRTFETGTATPATVEDQHIYPLWPWTPVAKLIRDVFLDLVMRGFVYVLAKPRVRFETRALPKTPMLIYGNHVTAMDAPLIQYALPGAMRRSTAIAMSGEILLTWRRRRYYRYRILNWISPLEYLVVTGLFNVFPLPQKSGFRRSFSHAARAMDRGYSVIVFPEGIRAEDETIQPFMSGAGLLWSELRCPALPVYLAGLGELKRTGERWFRSKKLAIHIGSPIPWQQHRTPEQGTKVLEEELRRLASQGKPIIET